MWGLGARNRFFSAFFCGFSVTTWEKNIALEHACVNYAGRRYPTLELGGSVAYSAHCYTPLWLGVSRALLCPSFEGQCSLLLWSKKFPFLTFTSSPMQAEKPDHLSHLELEGKTASLLHSIHYKDIPRVKSEGFCLFFLAGEPKVREGEWRCTSNPREGTFTKMSLRNSTSSIWSELFKTLKTNCSSHELQVWPDTKATTNHFRKALKRDQHSSWQGHGAAGTFRGARRRWALYKTGPRVRRKWNTHLASWPMTHPRMHPWEMKTFDSTQPWTQNAHRN